MSPAMTDPLKQPPQSFHGTDYRTTEQRHLQQHYGERTSAQLAQELGRPSAGAIRKYMERHPELRKPKA